MKVCAFALSVYLFFGLTTTALAAEVGQPAPGFTLTDTKGQEHSLSDFRGKTVILEWHNHDCPFVKKFYNAGEMQRLQAQYNSGDYVWLTINSSKPGKQGHLSAADANELMADKKFASTALLLDESGDVGRAYAAKTTPHMYIIDTEGTLRYAGAIDSIPSAKSDDIGKAENYVVKALEQLKAGEPVTTAVTKPYGCSVKY
jgi:peroxiredoxin